jgi:hypothetical protein
MGAITFSLDEKLVEFLAGELPFKLFVETGAFRGDSLALAGRYIPNCRSVEMSPELFEQVRARFQGQSNVQVFLGDSPSFLRQHQAEFASRAALFWLDAHWCLAEHTSGQSSQSPLLAELAALQSLHADSVVLIDDARLYLCPPPKPHHCADWPDFHSLLTALLSLGSRHRIVVLNDVIIFYPERIGAAMLEFAHNHGLDRELLIHQLKESEKAHQLSEADRRMRRFPSANYFRHLWRKILKKPLRHASS